MKYNVELELTDPNNSHVQVLDLVGSGKRVLDVGCATGYLDKVLTARGNTVTGVELDPEAAEIARPHLARLLIGNLETIDLVAELGAGGFDSVVFADVLEHLTNPLRILRQAPALLAPGGSVVVSIPNIAHGSMRLAMLQGRFEYRDLGLLDDTHLRFFTRSSLIDLHDQAGLTPVDTRRVIADPFATEISLDPADFPPPVMDRLRADPETMTYQFVIRSVPAEGLLGGAAPPGDDAGEELVARHHELDEARAQLRAISELSIGSGPPAAGVVIATDAERAPMSAALDELRATVIAAELRRRLDGWTIRTFETESTSPRPNATGTPIEPLLGTDGSLASLETLDAVVVTGSVPSGTDAPLSKATAAFAKGGVTSYLAGAIDGSAADTTAPDARGALEGWPAPRAIVGWAPPEDVQTHRDRVPDPLVLADRIFDPTALAHRGHYLRLAGALPTGDFLLLYQGDRHHLDIAVPAPTVAELADRGDLATVTLTGDHASLDALDLAATTASASMVISDDAGIVWLALALGRPTIGLDGDNKAELAAVASWLADPDLIATTPASLPAARSAAERRAADTRLLRRPTDALELFVDELAGVLAAAPARRLSSSLPVRLAEAAERIKVLELVNTQLRSNMNKQRTEFGQIARRANLGDPADGVSHVEHRALEERLWRAEESLRVARSEADAARHELESTYATLTMRTLAPVRRWYGRLRRPT